MSNDLQRAGDTTGETAIEKLIMGGDLAPLNAQERMRFYKELCDAQGLNPLTQPFQYIRLNGKLTLYATRNCTDQLRAKRHINLQIVGREQAAGCYVVTARATGQDGRTDESVGAVPIDNLRGPDLCNALMKAETKAKRRVTLSFTGLSLLDESEIETVAEAQPVAVNAVTGELPVAKALPAGNQALLIQAAKGACANAARSYLTSSGGKPEDKDAVRATVEKAASAVGFAVLDDAKTAADWAKIENELREMCVQALNEPAETILPEPEAPTPTGKDRLQAMWSELCDLEDNKSGGKKRAADRRQRELSAFAMSTAKKGLSFCNGEDISNLSAAIEQRLEAAKAEVLV